MNKMPAPLRMLAMGYLHEDYDLEHGSPMDAVAAFRSDSSPRIIDEAIRDFSALLDSRDEAGLRAAWLDEGGSAYNPAAHGMTYRQWFESVLVVLRGET